MASPGPTDKVLGMRLKLEQIDASGIDLDLGPDPAHERRIALRAARKLRGTLEQGQGSTRISDCTAEELIVSLLQLKFESFSLSLPTEGTLTALAGSYVHSSERTDLDLKARALTSPGLGLHFEAFEIRGELRATDVHLSIHGAEGRVRAESLEILDLRFEGEAGLSTDRLVARQVDVSWGALGYSVQVGELDLPQASAELDLSSGSRAPKQEEIPNAASRVDPAASSTVPPFEWSVLDGLSGALDVDVFVDMKVPVIGSRKATHRFRSQLREGAVNYLELERDLSALENALLDFAVRDDHLVLERGIPLLPTRGRGKPIIVWPLTADDLALTKEDRVRLAVLPHFRLAEPEKPDGPDAASGSEREAPGLVLRELSFVDLQAMLRLEPRHPSTTSLRDLSFEELLLQGTVHHRPASDARPGELTGSLRGLRSCVANFPLGSSTLDIRAVKLGRLSELRARFLGIRPERATFQLAELKLTSFSIGNR